MAWASPAGPFTWLNRNGASASGQSDSKSHRQNAGNEPRTRRPGGVGAASSHGQTEGGAAAQRQQPGIDGGSKERAFKSTDHMWQPKLLSQWNHQKPPPGMDQGGGNAPSASGSSVGVMGGAVRLRSLAMQHGAAAEDTHPASAAQSSQSPRLR
jgi:hypothetical protein